MGDKGCVARKKRERAETPQEHYKVQAYGKYGITQKNKGVILPIIFDSIEEFNDNGYIVKIGSKTGLYSTSGVELVKPQDYTSVTILDYGILFGWNKQIQLEHIEKLGIQPIVYVSNNLEKVVFTSETYMISVLEGVQEALFINLSSSDPSLMRADKSKHGLREEKLVFAYDAILASSEHYKIAGHSSDKVYVTQDEALEIVRAGIPAVAYINKKLICLDLDLKPMVGNISHVYARLNK